MELLSIKEIAARWGISSRRVQLLCETQRIYGAKKIGNSWVVPGDAEKPADRYCHTVEQARKNRYDSGRTREKKNCPVSLFLPESAAKRTVPPISRKDVQYDQNQFPGSRFPDTGTG